MLSLMASCRFPLLTLVTMRGEWAEFNPWQIPMGRATRSTPKPQRLSHLIALRRRPEPRNQHATIEPDQ